MAKKHINSEIGDQDYHRRNVVLPEGLAERALEWHGGQNTKVYSLGSTGMGDYVSPSMIDAAVAELEYDLAQNKKRPKTHRWDRKEVAELKELIGELDAVARFSSEHTSDDADSGYATWLMEEEESDSSNGWTIRLDEMAKRLGFKPADFRHYPYEEVWIGPNMEFYIKGQSFGHLTEEEFAQLEGAVRPKRASNPSQMPSARKLKSKLLR